MRGRAVWVWRALRGWMQRMSVPQTPREELQRRFEFRSHHQLYHHPYQE